jgi:hypothetical protein
MSTGRKKRSTDHRLKARVNSAALASQLARLNESVIHFAKRIDVSPESVYKWLGKRKEGLNPYITRRNLIEISNGLRVDPAILVYYGNGSLPSEAAFFEDVRYGWFIDNPRSNNQETVWLCEEVHLELTKGCSETGERLTFRGSFENCLGEFYNVEAERLTQHMFLLKGIGQQVTRCFVALVHRFIKYPLAGRKDFAIVLCGQWSGINVVGEQAVYRLFLSTDLLSQGDLQTITELAVIRSYLESGNFNEEIRTKHT